VLLTSCQADYGLGVIFLFLSETGTQSKAIQEGHQLLISSPNRQAVSETFQGLSVGNVLHREMTDNLFVSITSKGACRSFALAFRSIPETVYDVPSSLRHRSDGGTKRVNKEGSVVKLHVLRRRGNARADHPKLGCVECSAIQADSNKTAIREQATPTHCRRLTDSCRTIGTRTMTTTG
jgi:hypothetical protein